jgi:hypothetical protein
MPNGLIAILPCNDLQRSERFYAQLWFTNPNPEQSYDELPDKFGYTVIAGPEHRPRGMYEFALSDPDETLVRVGWPSKLTQRGQ